MEEREHKFQKLTPIKDVNLSIYKKTLDFVFENSDLKNIAITGIYGAGKSSVVETYKKKSDKSFIHISLAHFDFENTATRNEAVIEGKIINQLIHQMNPKKIPQTHFKIKKELSIIETGIITALIIIFLVCLLHSIYFVKWSNFIFSLSPMNFAGYRINKILEYTINNWARLMSLSLCIAIISFTMFYITKIQREKNIFRKFKFQNNEIEIFEDCNDSYFDKYLNEVLYIFENSGADAIVFEDMDRYDVHQIFERLREINTLINNQREKNNEKIIRFFYLLKDDIFVTKDRTKFFDFIIPVVPIMDSSNSYELFIEYFKNNGMLNLFGERFLQNVSLYVDDIRILKNIHNEFLIYYNGI